jgi:hypothetical protein
MAVTPDGTGAWLLRDDGSVIVKGRAPRLGDAQGKIYGAGAVAIVATRTGQGYWIAGTSGDVFHFGDAVDHGNIPNSQGYGPTPSTRYGGDQSATSMAAVPDGTGYYGLRSDGTVSALGSARFRGSPASDPNATWGAIASSPTGQGYWTVDSTGTVRGFGDAAFYGDLSHSPSPHRIVDLAPSPTGKGYTVVDETGAISTFGDAHAWGITPPKTTPATIVGITMTATGQGYWITATDGTITGYGDATGFG